MKKTCRVLFILLSILFFTQGPSFADGTSTDAIVEIATIMHRLKHYPSPAGKETLQKLAQNASTTANEKTIITAMLNLQHHVGAADKASLSTLVQDSKATHEERSIATILLNLDHRPTSQDKTILSGIIGK
ncbi:MAG: hypothetical protein ACC707_13110 [Thiohalomonadales bacterium]